VVGGGKPFEFHRVEESNDSVSGPGGGEGGGRGRLDAGIWPGAIYDVFLPSISVFLFLPFFSRPPFHLPGRRRYAHAHQFPRVIDLRR